MCTGLQAPAKKIHVIVIIYTDELIEDSYMKLIALVASCQEAGMYPS